MAACERPNCTGNRGNYSGCSAAKTEEGINSMNKKQILSLVLAIVVIAVILFAASALNLGPALVNALVTLHGGR